MYVIQTFSLILSETNISSYQIEIHKLICIVNIFIKKILTSYSTANTPSPMTTSNTNMANTDTHMANTDTNIANTKCHVNIFFKTNPHQLLNGKYSFPDDNLMLWRKNIRNNI